MIKVAYFSIYDISITWYSNIWQQPKKDQVLIACFTSHWAVRYIIYSHKSHWPQPTWFLSGHKATCKEEETWVLQVSCFKNRFVLTGLKLTCIYFNNHLKTMLRLNVGYKNQLHIMFHVLSLYLIIMGYRSSLFAEWYHFFFYDVCGPTLKTTAVTHK